MELEGKAALITGASGGIGAAVAGRLHDAGASVGLLSRRGDDLGLQRSLGVSCDVRDRRAVADATDAVVERFGRLDVVVANAGVGAYGPFLELDPELMEAMIDVNLKGTLYTAAATLQHLIDSGEGDFVALASVAGLRAFPGEAAYNASKFGQVGFTRALDHELRERGVRATCICPGGVKTGFAIGTGRTEGDPELDGMLTADEVADVVLFAVTRPRRMRILTTSFRPMTEAPGARSPAPAAAGPGARGCTRRLSLAAYCWGVPSVEGLRAADLVDAMGRLHRHRCHLLDLVSPTPGRVLFGPAVTISYFPSCSAALDPDRFNLGNLFYEAVGDEPEGKVVVLASNGYTHVSMGGGTKLSRLQNHGCAGVITDGRLRDFDQLAAYDFAAYCSGEATRWGGGEVTPFQANVPVVLSGVGVMPGQYVFADGSGAVLIPDGQIEDVIAGARAVVAEDAGFMEEMKGERLGGPGSEGGRSR